MAPSTASFRTRTAGFAGLALDASGRARYTVVVRLPGGGPGGGEPARVAARIVRLLPEA